MPATPARNTLHRTGPWWLVLCLIGLDYFSTLAYLPSLAVRSSGVLAPVAAALVVAVTLLGALPVYLYVVGRSPHGRGATGLIETLVSGWRGKLLILLLLAFVATDYVVTQNLSVADAAEHLRANPYFERHAAPLLGALAKSQPDPDQPLWVRLAARFDAQLVTALALSALTFALWAVWQRGSTGAFLRVSAVVVALYLGLTVLILAAGAWHLWGAGQPAFAAWRAQALGLLAGPEATGTIDWWRFARLAIASFPHVALGLSGFELSMAIAPFVAGRGDDDLRHPRGRIAGMRKLLVAAAVIMAAMILWAVTVCTVLCPPEAFAQGGPAVHRALAYLAHGGPVAGTDFPAPLAGWFGPVFGTLYDLSTVAILCLAGACVAIALRDYVPEYLQQFGMELDWARRLGVKMRFFNLVVVIVVIAFRAHLEALQWVYSTCVLVLLASASFAALLDLRQRRDRAWWMPAVALVAGANLAFCASMTLVTLAISRAGLEIALTFGLGIVITSFVSRWIRSTELRFRGFEFADDESRARWARACGHEFQVLIPHRPGLHARHEKVQAIRERHRLGSETPVILIEAELGDPSNFLQAPLMHVADEDGYEVIRVTRCVSIAHVLASIALEMARVGRPPELHFGWSDQSPLAANLNFLLFGEGNIPWMVRELLRKAQLDATHRPSVIVG